MGTAKDWIQVAIWALFGGVGFGFTSARGWFFGSLDDPFDWSTIPGLILAGLLFGLDLVLRSRALHPPILYGVLLVLAAALFKAAWRRIRP